MTIVRHLPATAVALGFIDRINRGDLEGLVSMMAADHRLEVFDEPPVVGRAANAKAWQGYLNAFPRYVIYPRRIAAAGGGRWFAAGGGALRPLARIDDLRVGQRGQCGGVPCVLRGRHTGGGQCLGDAVVGIE